MDGVQHPFNAMGLWPVPAGPGRSGRTYQYLGCREMTGRDGLDALHESSTGKRGYELTCRLAPARVYASYLYSVPGRLRVHTYPHTVIRPGTGTEPGPRRGGSWHRASQFVGVQFTSKMKRRHAGAIGRPGGSGAAPRARRRYAICNDGDTQGTLKKAIPRAIHFVVQQTGRGWRKGWKERRAKT